MLRSLKEQKRTERSERKRTRCPTLETRYEGKEGFRTGGVHEREGLGLKGYRKERIQEILCFAKQGAFFAKYEIRFAQNSREFCTKETRVLLTVGSFVILSSATHLSDVGTAGYEEDLVRVTRLLHSAVLCS